MRVEDEKFLDECLQHAYRRLLFSKEQLIRLHKLAGDPRRIFPAFMRLEGFQLSALVQEARALGAAPTAATR